MTTETTVEQTASTPVPVETAASTPADEGKAPESGTTETTASAAENPEKAEEKSKPLPGVQKRFNELTREKYELKNENAELKKRLDEIERKLQPQEPLKPKIADYGSDADYEAAMDQYYQKKGDYDSVQSRQRETQEQETQRKQQDQFKAAQKFVTDLQNSKAIYEGIDEIMADPAFALITKSMAPEIITLIQSSEKNVALAHHLGTHLDEAEQIASLPPVQAARALALLESRLEIPKPKTVTNAPPPVKPVGGSSVRGTDLYDPNTSYKEYDAVRKKQRAERRAR